MNYEIAFNVFLRVSALSLGAWLILLAVRSRSGSIRATLAGCGLLACVLVPALMPVTKAPPAPSPVVYQSSAPVQSEAPESSVSGSSAAKFVAHETSAGPSVPPENLALLLWLVGVSLLTARSAIGALRAAAISRQARPCELVGCRVRITPELISPMTVMPRTVVIPTEVADWPEAQLKPILAHEFAHARRFDAVTMFASGLVCAIAWPIPFVWLLRRELVRAIEDAADDHVLTQNIDPFTYAETLHRACQALRVAPASVPTFARKPMISARIERTLRSAVDRRRISPFYVVALVAVAAAAAAASAQGLLVQEPPAQNLPHIELKNAGKADVELVQLQTMDRSPIYWKPDGTRISVKDAITDNTAIPPKPGDIVVWLRVKTDRPDAMLWAPSLTIHGYTLPTNSGPSYRREGWLYSASRIATNGRKLPDYGDLNTSAYISDWTDLPPFLTADMIAKSQGKDKRFPLEGFYHSVKWEIRDHVWQHNKPGTRQVESEPPKQSILLDLGMKHGLDPIFDNFSTQFKFKDESKKGRVIYAASEKEEYDEAMTHQKYWLETDVSNIEKMWMQVRCGDHSVIKDVALRPKS